jgi:hypothetical protein
MTFSTFRRLIAVVALGVFLGMPLTLMAGPLAAAPRSESREITQAPLGWLWGLLTGKWTKEGCLIDRNGRCLNSQTAPGSQVTPKNGCSVDPYGRCIPGT